MWSAASRYAVVLVLLVGLFIFFSFTQANFFTRLNVQNLLTSVSILWVVSIGMTFVVLTAGIDLSVGSLLALSGIVLSKLFNDVGLPAPLAVAATIAIAALIGGLVNGALIGRVGLSFFVVTLGTMSLYAGIVSLWSHTETTYLSSSFIGSIGFGKGLGIPTPIWIMIATYLIAFVVLRWTYFGRDVYAVGGNIEAARLSGINVARTLMIAYGIAGLSSGIAGVIEVGRLGAASPMVGSDIPLNAAAAVLLGGTSFLGGVGGVSGTAVGVLFIGTLQNGLAIAGVQSFWQQVVTGVILIVAIAIDRLQRGASLLPRRDSATPPSDSSPPASAGAPSG
jgi:ribose/xylose/arabinose/galactoside ABC-type transport system permease subunit